MAVTSPQPQVETALRLEITSKFFRALGDPTRLSILRLLLKGEKRVGEIVAEVGLGQGRVSNHLACLRQCGFVATRREGQSIYYRIARPEVRDLLEISQGMIAANAERIWACTQVDGGEEAGPCPALLEVPPVEPAQLHPFKKKKMPDRP